MEKVSNVLNYIKDRSGGLKVMHSILKKKNKKIKKLKMTLELGPGYFKIKIKAKALQYRFPGHFYRL